MDIDTYKHFKPNFKGDSLYKWSTHRFGEVRAAKQHEAEAIEAALSGTTFVLYGDADPLSTTAKGYDSTSAAKIAALYGEGAVCTPAGDKSRAKLVVPEAVTAAHIYEVFDADQKAETPTVTGVTLDHVDRVQAQA